MAAAPELLEELPAEIMEVVEPAPELPQTGAAAPISSGIGLILAASGLIIRRINR